MPYMILKSGKRTIHRGIKNRSGIPRPVFWINHGIDDYVVKETSHYSFEKQQQRRNSKSTFK